MRFFAMLLILGSFQTARAQFLVQDVGVLGLMSHDIFAWDARAERNTENGRIDLSTIFDYDNGSRWELGGNPKNEENAPVYTITMQLVNYYKEQLDQGKTAPEARKETVKLFHKQVKESYVRAFNLPFPKIAQDGTVTNSEQAIMRAFHDILPGKITLYSRPQQKELIVTEVSTAKTFLNSKELQQKIKNLDGKYDAEYHSIAIPGMPRPLDLQAVDKSFIEKFSSYKQESLLAELQKVGQGSVKLKDLPFSKELANMMAKAVCGKDNTWMPQDIRCE